MATQIKLYIDAEGEIRRFTLEQAATYASLQQRIQKLVGRDNFRLFWQDAEGDFVICGSDDELRDARQAMVENAPLRVFLRRTNQSDSSNAEKKVHVHVICDGCQGEVAGTRYKCLECPDFDLCESCEENGKHREHDMVAVRSPGSAEWKKWFGQGYGSRPGCRRGPGGMNRPCGGPRASGSRGPGCPMGPGAFHGPPGAGFHGFVPPFFRQFTPLIDSAVEMDVNFDRPFPEVMAEVTRKVMEAVTKARGEAEAHAQAEKAATDKAAEEEHVTQVEKVEVAQAPPTVVTPVVTQVAETVRQPVEILTTPEVENGWTVLKSEPVEGEAVKAEEKKVEVDASNQDGNRIESALRAMEGMGFPTEGTLLRRLLQNYNGDISRVLDSIR